LQGIDFAQVLIGFLVLLFSLTVHEAAHAWSADRLGDSTARMLGRLSLNPAVHAELIGTVIFPLIALTTNLPVIGWAKPVPVDIRQLHGNWRRKFMLIAAAGPISNLVLATLAALVLRLVAAGDPSAGFAGPAFVFLQTAIYINVILAVFNMLPIPPLDGGNVLSGLLRGQAAYTFNRLRPYGFLVLYGLMLTGMLGIIVMPAARLIWSWLL
jgi:Zn-dependent protease